WIILKRHAHGKFVVHAQLPDPAEMLLGYCEVDENRRHAVDDDEGRISVRLYEVSGMYEKVAGSAGDGSVDGAITDVELRLVHSRDVRFERRTVAFNCSLGSVNGFPRDIGRSLRLIVL